MRKRNDGFIPFSGSVGVGGCPERAGVRLLDPFFAGEVRKKRRRNEDGGRLHENDV